jgi:DNA uptake protein ComE-like DNA-binding protein
MTLRPNGSKLRIPSTHRQRDGASCLSHEVIESRLPARTSNLGSQSNRNAFMKRLQQLLCLFCVALVAGCGQSGQQKRGEKTREAVARATERMKPELQWTATKVGVAAKWVADEALAAAEGFFEGWTKPPDQLIDLNSATNRQLESLPGITPEEAHRIVRSRPYPDKKTLVTRGVISESSYRRIKERITVN